MQLEDKSIQYILDASFFFVDAQAKDSLPNISDAELWTTDMVADEIKDLASKMRFEVLLSNGLKIGAPSNADIEVVKAKALASGDARVLSDTDISVIALALSMNGTVVSGDFAVQNVCRHLKIKIISLRDKTAKKKVWKLICSGCGAEIPAGNTDCPICGSLPKKRGTERDDTKQVMNKKKRR